MQGQCRESFLEEVSLRLLWEDNCGRRRNNLGNYSKKADWEKEEIYFLSHGQATSSDEEARSHEALGLCPHSPWLESFGDSYHQRILFKFFTVSEHSKKSSFLKSAFNPQIIFFHLYSLDSEKREDFCVCVLLSVGSLSSRMINTHLKILICCYPFEKL